MCADFHDLPFQAALCVQDRGSSSTQQLFDQTNWPNQTERQLALRTYDLVIKIIQLNDSLVILWCVCGVLSEQS